MHRVVRTAISALAVTGAALAVSVVVPSSAQAASTIQIVRIQYDSPGVDNRSNASLNNEWIAIKNVGRSSAAIGGWRIHDKANHVYVFGTTTIGAGTTLYVHTGKGTLSYIHRYWGSGAYIWNNDNDTAWLRTPTGGYADHCGWTRTGSGAVAC